MTKVVGVLPYIYEPFYRQFVKTHTGEIDICAINNTTDNVGVAESWNRGIDFMRYEAADWLLIISATMRFYSETEQQILDHINRHKNSKIIHFATENIKPQKYAGKYSPPYNDGVFYWHCTAVHKSVFKKVGYFDPNFYPVYFEDTDYELRLKKAYGTDQKRVILPIKATSMGLRHGVEKAKIKFNPDASIAYFSTKWGIHPNAIHQLASYKHPFDNKENTIKFFPPALGRQWHG